jgi:hypothetical protein
MTTFDAWDLRQIAELSKESYSDLKSAYDSFFDELKSGHLSDCDREETLDFIKVYAEVLRRKDVAKATAAAAPAAPAAPAVDSRCRLLQYSEKSVAVLGNTKPIKEQLKALKGRFNPALTDPATDGARCAGWIFPLTARPAVEKLLASC